MKAREGHFDLFALTADRSPYLAGRGKQMESFLRERAAAAVIGVKTATLKKWRQRGRGPRGWFHLSATCVLYPSSEVESFIGDLQRAEPGKEAGDVEEVIDPRSALEQPNEAAQG